MPDIESRADIDALMVRVLSYAEKRNKIAHGIWGVDPNETDAIFRIPVKKWIVFLASLIPNRADAGDIIDELNEHVEEYQISDLVALENQGVELMKDVVLAFTTLADKMR